MKKFTARTAVIAVALILVTTVAALALSGAWNVDDYLKNRFGRDMPDGFTSGYQQMLTQTIGGVQFTIRDAYIERDILYMMVNISLADGQNAVFLGASIMRDDFIHNLFLGENSDKRTVAEYAKDNGLPIIDINTWIEQDGLFEGTMGLWIEEDGTTTCALSAHDVSQKDGVASFDWCVDIRREDGAWQQEKLAVSLMVIQRAEWEIDIGQPVEGTAVILDKVIVYEGGLGMTLDILYHIDPAAPEELQALGRDALWFEALDPQSGEPLPEGHSLLGTIEPNEAKTAFRQKGTSVSKNWRGDAIVLRAYDCWEKTRFGQVTVDIQQK